ncbi:hypothetical protein CR513_38327, partial [Mucuna pruriens]
MARFIHGLNKEIQDMVELYSYGVLGELVHQAVKRSRDKEKDKVRSDKSPKKGSEPFQCQKEIVFTPSPSASRTSSIECFKCLGKGHIASQCPNRTTMIVREDGEVASDSSHEETSISSELESRSDDSHCEEDLLMVRRLMGS